MTTMTTRPRGTDHEDREPTLTPREREILRLLAEGAGTKEIAADLYISANTVRTHVQSLLTKLEVNSRLRAVALAIRHGLIPVPGPGS